MLEEAAGLFEERALVRAVALAASLLGRVPHQRFLQLSLAAYFVGLLGLTYAGTWRAGWYDSANRMLTHALPALVWLGMLRAAAIVPPGVGSRSENSQLASTHSDPPLSGGWTGDP